jgi:hypothetical protein
MTAVGLFRSHFKLHPRLRMPISLVLVLIRCQMCGTEMKKEVLAVIITHPLQNGAKRNGQQGLDELGEGDAVLHLESLGASSHKAIVHRLQAFAGCSARPPACRWTV